jgi:hypothetical protein
MFLYGTVHPIAMAGDAGSAMAFPPGSLFQKRRPPRVPRGSARNADLDANA